MTSLEKERAALLLRLATEPPSETLNFEAAAFIRAEHKRLTFARFRIAELSKAA